jgi:purine-binding chemotaxis protein CheW
MGELLMAAAAEIRTGSEQYLTFFCAEEGFGVEILRVREIKGWTSVTQVPEAPAHVLGIMNLRGDIVPVVDLRTRFGFARRSPDASTVLIVVSASSGRGEGIVGICVDGVHDVHGFEAGAVTPPPDLGAQDASGYVRGVASRDGKILMLLDIDKVIGTEQPDG